MTRLLQHVNASVLKEYLAICGFYVTRNGANVGPFSFEKEKQKREACEGNNL